jgi:deoxycytidylate deaminase
MKAALLAEQHLSQASSVMSTDFISQFRGYDFKPATDDDLTFFEIALHVRGWSKFPARTQGSVTIKDGRILSVGFNAIPAHLQDADPKWNNHPFKRDTVCCAERIDCGNGDHVYGNKNENWHQGATKIITWMPCDNSSSCADLLIERKTKDVVVLVRPKDLWPDDPDLLYWANTMHRSIEKLFEAGIEIRVIDAFDPALNRRMGVDLTTLMDRKPKRPLIASGTTDWPQRFFDFGHFIRGLGGSGEIIVAPPQEAGDTRHKIIRAIGFDLHQPGASAIEIAEKNGVSIDGCLLFAHEMPDVPLRVLRCHGIEVVFPEPSLFPASYYEPSSFAYPPGQFPRHLAF